MRSTHDMRPTHVGQLTCTSQTYTNRKGGNEGGFFYVACIVGATIMVGVIVGAQGVPLGVSLGVHLGGASEVHVGATFGIGNGCPQLRRILKLSTRR
jgi:hypothetical protein